MAATLVAQAHRVKSAQYFLQRLANSSFYMFVADHVPRQTSALPDVFDEIKENTIDVYRNLIAGKLVRSNDLAPVIRRISYEANTIYAMYDDSDPEILTKDFYAIVNAGAFSHVWKCLDNNQNTASADAPEFADIDARDEVYQTSDGYRWKYMASLTDIQVSKFASVDWFPLVANSSVANAAVDGAIDIVRIANTGEGYDNYLTGTFSTGDVRVSGNSQLYSITNSVASLLPGFYTGCLLYISAGTGVGQYKTVANSFSNGNGKFIVLENEFEISPVNGSEYEIYPEVIILGDGSETTAARARALVNSAGNSIYRVEMLERGAGYKYISANVMANVVVDVISEAVFHGIYGPPGGHGANASLELGATATAVSVKFSNTEQNTIPATNYFQQIGLIDNPVFSYVSLNLVDTTTIPTLTEEGRVFDYRFMANGATSNQGSNKINYANGVFDTQFSPDDYLYLYSVTEANHQLVQVASVTNSSQLVLVSNALWTDLNLQIGLANVGVSMYAQSVETANSWTISNVSGPINTGDQIIFQTTGAKGTVETVSRGGTTKGFVTFVGLHKHITTAVSGTFQENETVYQGTGLANATATGALHSAISNGGLLTIYVSNQVGTFAQALLTGANSGAVANVSGASYAPEILFGSGKPLYIEAISPIQRAHTTSETIILHMLF